jgi:hypothetical protein
MEIRDLISELVKNYDKKDHLPFGVVDNTLYGKKDLEPIKDKILQFPEFSGLTSLEIINSPSFVLEGRTITAATYKLSDVSKFKGNGYILSFALTPEMYDPKKLHEPVKDGAAITPALYDPKTFEPKKKILIEFSPEMAQDLQMANGEAILRQHLHDLLDKVLDNPEDYRVKGERAVLVRGFFDDVDGKKQDTPPLSVVMEEPKYKMVFYMNPVIDTENGQTIKMELKRKYIPIELEDEFMKLFEEKIKNLSLTESEIDKFLEENKK